MGFFILIILNNFLALFKANTIIIYNLVIKHSIKMKNIFLILSIITSTIVFAQINEGSDGLFYATNGTVYSGNYLEYYANGQKKVEMHITNGMKDGEITIYFEDGSINEKRNYKLNINDGLWQTFNAKNIKIAEANYLVGKKNGKWLVWDDNGILRFEMYYENGKKTSTWKMWDETGKLISEKTY